MIKKLRIKFIAVAMISLFTVLIIIMSAVNILNYRDIVSHADSTLEILEMNDGKFPMRGNKPFAIKDFGDGRLNSPELPYESRFFSVLVNDSGNVVYTDTDHIAAVDKVFAKELAESIINSGKTRGFTGNYRYVSSEFEEGTRIIFLDCTRDLSTFRTFLLASCGISVAGLIAVFGLIVLLSGRMIRPISESYEKQKEFITNAGHELKTPVTIIEADAEVLELEIGENEWISDIITQAERLSTLTKDLVYLSRMEEEISMQVIDFPLSDVVTETAQSFQALSKTQNRNLNIDVEPMVSFSGDEKAIRQLISIFLDNALKYSTENSTISLTMKKQNKTVSISVSNISENLSKEDIPHLFDRFYRSDKSRNSDTGGYGIGLSIAKAIVKAHKGKITAASSDGSMFTITAVLPL